MDLLPDELLLRILDQLSAGDLLTAGKVCVRWNRLTHDAHLWRHRTYHVGAGVHSDAEAVAFLRDSQSLRTVAFSRCVSSVVTRCLATHCRTLTSLKLAVEQDVGYFALRALTRTCDQITHLEVSTAILRCKRRAGLVAQMPRLQKLVVVGASEPALTELAHGCLALRSLQLTNVAGRLGDLGVPLLQRLEELAISWDLVSPAIRHCAQNLRRLTLHNFTYAKCNEVELAEDLAHLRGLTHVTATEASDKPVLVFALLQPGLRSLNLAEPFSSVDDRMLHDVVRLCPQLEEIDVSGSKLVTSTGLYDMWLLRRLRSLNLSYCFLLDRGTIVHLARCKRLKELHLQGLDLQLILPGMEQLRKMRKLRVLSLRAWTARNWFPWYLLPKLFPHLERLDLGSWETRGPTYIDSLKAAMPHTQIQWSLSDVSRLLQIMEILEKDPKPDDPTWIFSLLSKT